MAKFSTESIDGFDAMTPEEQVAALLEQEIPEEVDMNKFVSKELFDKAASERAALSKQLKEKESALKSKSQEQMTETEKLQEQIREMQEANQAEIEALKASNEEMVREKRMSFIQANFSMLKADEKLNLEISENYMNQDDNKFFASLKKFLEAHDRAFEAELMSRTPRPDGYGNAQQAKENPGLSYVRNRAAQRTAAAKQAEEGRNKYLN